MSGRPRLDLTGQRFGLWYVAAFSGIRNGASIWVCVCNCGAEKLIPGGQLTSGQTTRCRGCRNIAPRDRGAARPDTRGDRMLQLLAQGWTLGEVARRFNVTRQRVHQIVGPISNAPIALGIAARLTGATWVERDPYLASRFLAVV